MRGLDGASLQGSHRTTGLGELGAGGRDGTRSWGLGTGTARVPHFASRHAFRILVYLS